MNLKLLEQSYPVALLDYALILPGTIAPQVDAVPITPPVMVLLVMDDTTVISPYGMDHMARYSLLVVPMVFVLILGDMIVPQVDAVLIIHRAMVHLVMGDTIVTSLLGIPMPMVRSLLLVAPTFALIPGDTIVLYRSAVPMVVSVLKVHCHIMIDIGVVPRSGMMFLTCPLAMHL